MPIPGRGRATECRTPPEGLTSGRAPTDGLAILVESGESCFDAGEACALSLAALHACLFIEAAERDCR